MIVVFDTCVIFDDWFLKSSSISTIKRYSKIILPAVVVDELKSKYEEKLNKVYTDFSKSYNDIIRLQVKNISSFLPVDEDGICGIICDDDSFLDFIKKPIDFIEEYNQFIIQQVLKEEILIADYPTMPHQEIVKRALLGRKPFSGDGKKGYRDYLIWLSVLDISQNNSNEEIHFISSNVLDFAKSKQESDKRILHSDFDDDFNGLNINYWSSINDLFNDKIKPILEADKVFVESGEKEQLISKIIEDEDLIKTIEELVNQKAVGFDYYDDEIEEIYNFNDLESDYNIDLSFISDDEYLLNITFSTFCSIKSLIEKAELTSMPKKWLRQIAIVNPNYNDFYALTSFEAEVDITAQMIFEKSSFTVKGLEIIGTEDGSCPYCTDYDDHDENDDENMEE